MSLKVTCVSYLLKLLALVLSLQLWLTTSFEAKLDAKELPIADEISWYENCSKSCRKYFTFTETTGRFRCLFQAVKLRFREKEYIEYNS